MRDEQLLELLTARPGEYISGEEISRLMSVSRTAIWKGINRLKEQGYEFDSVSRKGYRIVRYPDRFDEVSLRLQLSKSTSWGQPLHLLDSIGSTQDVARELAEQGAVEGTLVIAEEQTAGRGRQGRRFHSPPGRGVWMTVVMRPQQPLQYTSQLTLLAAVAICRALRNVSGLDIGIKWPNDLLIDGRKVCGILVESAAEDGYVRYALAGFGIDVNLAPEDLPEDVRPVATSLRIQRGEPVDRTAVVTAIMSELESLYGLYNRDGFAPISALWEALAFAIGSQVTVKTLQGPLQGIARGLGPNGELLLEQPDGQVLPVYSGEVGF
ncbi:biotin--[acetyl-CoA-carboxylase] ligase [Paenibacillus sp. WLX1005]|uniref:biotin--[acetyl-CoA-carboxylase] ligase n=1 Tax=Paenibacillus sp. WLX1005 TaxID=3243766 RepID=UPI003983DE8E